RVGARLRRRLSRRRPRRRSPRARASRRLTADRGLRPRRHRGLVPHRIRLPSRRRARELTGCARDRAARAGALRVLTPVEAWTEATARLLARAVSRLDRALL